MKNNINIKLWALIGLVIIISNNSYSQETGPSNPDFYGFEPVDATDMVNPINGDLTYTIPLLSVPGPGGGYPVTLSYRAGVGVNQESTWVGMGWRLTPGGIHRRTNGVPDDVVAVNRNRVTVSGEAEYTTVSAAFQTAKGVTFGATASWGDYQSVGVFGGAGGVSGYIDTKANVGITANPIRLFTPKAVSDAKPKSPAVSLNVGASYNLKSGELGGSLGVMHKSSLGVSLSANSEGMSLNGSYMGNSLKNKNVSTNSTSTMVSTKDGLTVPIPVGAGIFSIGYHKTKVDWTSNSSMITIQNGLMHEFSRYDIHRRTESTGAMDVNEIDYSEYYFQNSVEGAKQPTILLPAYDDFNVVAQGMSFSMSNKLMETGMLTTYGNLSGKNKDIFYAIPFGTKISSDYQSFQVNNTNSDNWTIRPGTPDINISSSDILSTDVLNGFLYEEAPVTFHSKSNTPSNQRFINNTYRFGKKYISYFTNAEIVAGLGSDFIEGSNLNTVKRQSMPEDGIGAYRITNEQGVTYHYSVPVYQDVSITRSLEDFTNDDDLTAYYSQSINDNKYANSWLLTAITGPDYIDVNNNGLDKEDYGYWVEMDYGLLHEHYLWKNQTPIKKSYSRPKEEWSSKTYGLKQIYYLDKIRTASHTAMFFKGERKDGYSGGINGGIGSFNTDVRSSVDDVEVVIKNYTDKMGYLLNLENIVLFKNDNLPSIVQQSHSTTKYCNTCEDDTPQLIKEYPGTDYDETIDIGYHLMDNVLDYKDYEAHAADIEEKAIRIVNLNYGYDIMNGSYNSDAPNHGKLNLSKITHYARNKHQVLPPQEFEYYLDHSIDNTTLASGFQDREVKTDSWGYYSSDYNNDEAQTWSLKTIKNPLGSKINITYENDEFINEYALGTTIRNRVTDIEEVFDDNYKMTFPNEFGNEFQVNDIIKLRFKFEVHEDGLNSYLETHITNQDPNSDIIVGHTDYIAKVTNVDPQHKYLNVMVYNSTGDYSNTTYHPISANVFFYLVAKKIGFNKHTKFYELEAIEQNPQTNKVVKGGGLRVAQISLTDNNTEFNTNYDYSTFGTNTTSGYTSYTPKEFYRSHYIPYSSLIPSPGVSYANVSITKTSSESQDAESTTQYSFNIPKSCGNCYGSEYTIPGYFSVKENIPVSNQLNIINGSNNYTHEHDDVEYHMTNGNVKQYSNLNVRDVEINNNLTRIGELESIERLNSFGQVVYKQSNTYNDNVISSKEEGYYNRKILHDYQPGLGFAYNSAGDVIPLPAKRHYYNYFNTTVTYKETPRVLTQTKTESQGVYNTVEYKDFDLLLGTARTILTENSFGDKHRTYQVFAHEIDAYGSMGPKSENPENKNMLTQTAASYLFIDNGNSIHEDDPVIDASITTWNNDWKYREFINNQYTTSSNDPDNVLHEKIWRKKTTYSWRSKLDPETGAYLKVDGSNSLFNTNDYFDFENESTYLNSNQGWVNNSEITLYDHYSNSREIKDVNGQYASSKTWKGLTVSNIVGASYARYCSSGAEELKEGESYDLGVHPRYFETETQMGAFAKLSKTVSHTGNNSILLEEANKQAFVSHIPFESNLYGEMYMVSVWVKGDIGENANHVVLTMTSFGGNIDVPLESLIPEIIQAGEWYQLRYRYPLGILAAVGGNYLNTVARVSIGSNDYNGTLYFDDYRLYPIGASMSSYVYDELDRVQYVLNANNLATKYEYDDSGRLKYVYSEKVGVDGGLVLTAESEYNFLRDNE